MGRRALEVDCFESPQGFREFFKAGYGPTIAVYRALADDQDRAAELDALLDDPVARHARSGHGRMLMDWEYLLWTATRR